MSTEPALGPINGHIVGRVLKEAVRRAMVTIRAERLAFEANEKQGYDGGMNDVFTSADKKAQEVYLRTFEECFPSCGVIAEEDQLRIESSNGCRAYFTVDPLDGTRAFIRRQSHGVGTMVSLVEGDEVLAAYVGDINTREVYGYRPGSEHVFRITELDTFEELSFHSPMESKQSYVLLREPPERYSSIARAHIQLAFKSHLIDGSSIGTWMARLWKREVAAAIIPGGGFTTPWDATPVMGIAKKLGYTFLTTNEAGTAWDFYEFTPRTEVVRNERDICIVHGSEAAAFVNGHYL